MDGSQSSPSALPIYSTATIVPQRVRYTYGMHDTNRSAYIWSVADLLRGDYKQPEYGKVILPYTRTSRLIACSPHEEGGSARA